MTISPGDRFGRLTAVASEPGRKWLFRCDCGGAKSAFGSNVERGLTQSCGCLRREVSGAKNRTHGHTADGLTSATFKAWSHAKARCYNPADRSFPDYGGRGIGMVPRWREDFAAFLADMGECPKGLTIDRIDSNGDYGPENCRWASRTVQSRNRRGVHMVQWLDRQVAMSEVCEIEGVDYQRTYHQVVRRGRTMAEAIQYVRTEPLGAKPSRRRAG